MKTTMTPLTAEYTLFADRTSGKKVGTVTLPMYEDKPQAIVHGDVIYLPGNIYPYKSYHAVELVHVADSEEFTPFEAEPEPKPIPQPIQNGPDFPLEPDDSETVTAAHTGKTDLF